MELEWTLLTISSSHIIHSPLSIPHFSQISFLPVYLPKHFLESISSVWYLLIFCFNCLSSPAMPGTIKVSVLGFMDLPSSSSSSISVTVSMGKKQYQSWDKGDFAFSLASLRDVLVIAVNNVEGNEISRADIQAKSIVEKGFWDDHFPLAGGGRVHLQLQFTLNQNERDRIRTMRQSAMKKKQEEYHSINFQSMGDMTMARSNLNPELSDMQKYLLQVRELRGKDGRNLSSPALTSIKLESGEKSIKTEEKQTAFDQLQQKPNYVDRQNDSSSTAPVLPEINIHRSESSQEKTDSTTNSRSLGDNVPLPSVSLEEDTNLLKPSGLIALSEGPSSQSPEILPEVHCQSSNEQLAQKTVTSPVDEIPVQTISSEEYIQPSESTIAYGIEPSISSDADEERVHKAENRIPVGKTPITVMQMNTFIEGSQAQDISLQIKLPSMETHSNAVNEQKSSKEDKWMKPKKENTKPSSSASDTEAFIFEDPKHDEEDIKKREQKIKLPESLKRTELLGDALLQKLKATALGEKIEDSRDRPKEVYTRDKPQDEKAESRPAEVFVKDQSKEFRQDIKKRDEKINVLESLERTKISGDRLLQKSKATALEEKIEYSIDPPEEVYAMNKPRDEKAENQPTEAHIKDQSKEVCMKKEIEPQEFIETSIMEVEAATVSEIVAADQLGKTQLANLVDNPVEMESTRKTPSKNFLEISKPGVSKEEQLSERSNIWIFPDDATKICVTSGGKTLADLMGNTGASSSFYHGEMINSMEEHRAGSRLEVFKGTEMHPENRKSKPKPLIPKGAETSEGRLGQTLKIAIMVGFGTLMLFTRQRKRRNNRVVVRSMNLQL